MLKFPWNLTPRHTVSFHNNIIITFKIHIRLRITRQIRVLCLAKKTTFFHFHEFFPHEKHNDSEIRENYHCAAEKHTVDVTQSPPQYQNDGNAITTP